MPESSFATPRQNSLRSRSNLAAFSLIEILVVIGIIAILIGILLPTLAAAKRQANLVRCGVNLRTIAHGSILHAQEHRNYLPLAGMLRVDHPVVFDVNRHASGLGDRERKRYTYASGFGAHLVAPFVASVAPYLSAQKLRFDDWNALDIQLNDKRGVWQYFMCPQTDAMDKGADAVYSGMPAGQLTMMVMASGPTNGLAMWWATNTDFGINEGVLGFDYRYPARRLAGNQGRIARPAHTMLLCDAINTPPIDPALPASFQVPWGTIAPALESTGPVTLADVLARSPNVTPHRAYFDQRRHRGKMNVVFADGHVETVNITAGDLERIFLIAK